MSDIIRVDLTPAEAQTVLRALDDATRRPLFGDYFHLLAARTKVRRAAENPLNGPTFAFAGSSNGRTAAFEAADGGSTPSPAANELASHSDVEIDARDAAIDAEDTARLDEEHERLESIPDDEIPY